MLHRRNSLQVAISALIVLIAIHCAFAHSAGCTQGNCATGHFDPQKVDALNNNNNNFKSLRVDSASINLAGYPDYAPPTGSVRSKEFAFVGLLLNDFYVPGLIALAHSIRVHHPIAPGLPYVPLIVLVAEDSVSQASLALLARHPIDNIVKVRRIANPFFNHGNATSGSESDNPVFEWTFTKLHAWRLEQFSRLILVDLDFLFLKNVEELFRLPSTSSSSTSTSSLLYAAPDNCPPAVFNSGMMVFSPSADTYRDMLSKLNDPAFKSFEAGDQGFLNLYFPDWQPLRSDYNYLKFFGCSRDRSQEYLATKTFERVKGLHYTGAKPWQCSEKNIDCNLVTLNGQTVTPASRFAHHGLHALWWSLYDNVCRYYPCPVIQNQYRTLEM